MRFVLDVPVNPVPWERPAGGASRYKRDRSRQFALDFQTALLTVRDRPREPLEGDVAVTMRLYRNCGPGHRQRGDIDNLEKAILDAGNGVLWVDDVQVTHVTKSIEAAGPDVEGRVFLIVWSPPSSEGGALMAMHQTVERLQRARERVLSNFGAGEVARLDQVASAVREQLALADVDLDDPLVRRAVLRILDQVLHSSHPSIAALRACAALAPARPRASEGTER